jgi:hypothetical protein
MRSSSAPAIEIVSPGDESWDKLPFYAAHAVDEVLIVDPAEHAVHWLGLSGGEYVPIERSGLVALGPSGLAEQIETLAARTHKLEPYRPGLAAVGRAE